MNIPWKYHENTMNIPWKYHKHQLLTGFNTKPKRYCFYVCHVPPKEAVFDVSKLIANGNSGVLGAWFNMAFIWFHNGLMGQ